MRKAADSSPMMEDLDDLDFSININGKQKEDEEEKKGEDGLGFATATGFRPLSATPQDQEIPSKSQSPSYPSTIPLSPS